MQSMSDVVTPRESHPHSIKVHDKYAFVIIHHMNLHDADGFGDPVCQATMTRLQRSGKFGLPNSI